jgi:hypothetical protein
MIVDKVDYNGFKKIVEQKNTMPFDINKIDFDTKEELDLAQDMIKKSQIAQKESVKI